MNSSRLLLFAVLPFLAHAATIQFASSPATPNDSGLQTVAVPPNPAWAAPVTGSSWISVAQSGNPGEPGYVQLPNGFKVMFEQPFALAGLALTASLDVLADDTTDVWLNGHRLAAASSVVDSGGHCNTSIGCVEWTEGHFFSADLLPWLKVGDNELDFQPVQLHGSSFGLSYAGRVSSEVPEPGTWMLVLPVCICLCVLKAWMHKRWPL